MRQRLKKVKRLKQPMHHEYHIYILQCSDNSYYIGVTNSLNKRILEHQEGKDNQSYTFNKRPLKLVFNAGFTDIEIAIAMEKKIKGWTRSKKECLIRGDFELLPALSKKSF